ncbi:phage terminase large subunit [Sphingomonas sp. MMS24-JH45]
MAGLQDHTSESIKSYEGFDVAWVEEAQTVSTRSLNLLRPTIRSPGSGVVVQLDSVEQDAVDVMLRGETLPTGAIVVEANWNNNPWFPGELEQERQDCLVQQPEQYDHIWDGGYVSVAEGAYFARQLQEARNQGRVTDLSFDPLMPLRAYWDIGIRDATAIWVSTQQIGGRVNCLRYYEAIGQDDDLTGWRDQDTAAPNVSCPTMAQRPMRLRRSASKIILERLGFRFARSPIRRGAAMKRVETARRVFPSIWLDKAGCDGGLKALGWYHEKRTRLATSALVLNMTGLQRLDAFGRRAATTSNLGPQSR